MLQRWKLTIEYDGAPFCGWQRQEGLMSVQQVVEEAITRFCRQDIRLHCAGRTDAGVHAKGQVAHFDLDYGSRPLNGFILAKALNAHLTEWPIAIIDAQPVDADFHARFTAKRKLYRYRLLRRSAPPTLEKNHIWHVKRPLDVAAMRKGAVHLLGQHDFSTFRASKCQAKSPVRTLDAIDIRMQDYDCTGGQEIRFDLQAQSFLHHQVRNIVGTLVKVGLGDWQPDQVANALAAKDRRCGGPTAPACGLYLINISYI